MNINEIELNGREIEIYLNQHIIYIYGGDSLELAEDGFLKVFRDNEAIALFKNIDGFNITSTD